MTTLTILRGVPASGKTTHARVMQEAGAARVCRDDIRFAMYGKYWGVDENVVTQVENEMIASALRAGQDTVVDATNLSNKFLKTKLSLASRYDAVVEFTDFPIGMSEAVARDENRERTVGEKVIQHFFRQYKIDPTVGVLPPAPQRMPRFYPYVRNMDKRSAYIVDTDGTVANHEGVRSPYDTSRYEFDTVHRHVAGIVQALNNHNIRVIGLSGRDERFRTVTENWWLDHGLGFDDFHMRPEGDRRMDALVKYDLFKLYIEPEYYVLGAFDDRPQVIRMWETIGVPVFNVGTGVEF